MNEFNQRSEEQSKAEDLINLYESERFSQKNTDGVLVLVDKETGHYAEIAHTGYRAVPLMFANKFSREQESVAHLLARQSESYEVEPLYVSLGREIARLKAIKDGSK